MFRSTFTFVLASLSAIALFSSGCIVVGLAPKEEIRTHEVRDNVMDASKADDFSMIVMDVGNPEVSVVKEDANKLRISVNAIQSFRQSDYTANYREKWEVEDNWAMSIGLFPGYGPAIFNPKSYFGSTNHFSESSSVGFRIIDHSLFAPFANVFSLGIPTIASLLGGLGETGTMADVGLVGACAFETGKPVGKTMIEQKIENVFAHPKLLLNSGKQGINVILMATVEIPSMWYRQTIAIPPRIVSDHVESSAILELPISMPQNATVKISLSFIDESNKYGALLKSYDHMVSEFTL